MTKRFMILFAMVLFALVFSEEAKAQWANGNVAVRTNGNNFQSGDQLKVELLPLELINERFYTQVSYRFNVTIEEKDDDGKVTKKRVEKKIERQASPILESLKAFQMIALDDSFHFGDASPTGRYIVEVRVFQAYTNRLLATLRSCVIFQSSSEEQECETFLRALKTVNTEMFFTFDGRFNPSAYYSVIFLNRDKVVSYIEAGAYTNGASALNLSSDKLNGLAGQTLDILILDKYSGVSSALARASIASAK
ncbi:MAG TPA: hypothetical protein VFV58_20830 [Blastocatellia bacterium]|jgi:hypothetical protein|nr:hypothetical protein [Blastocatellia bacterium]